MNKDIQKMFLYLALNIDKKEYIQKFIEYKDDWVSGINQEVKEFLFSIIKKQETLDDSFLEVLEFTRVKEQEKAEFASKFSQEQGLEVVESFSDKLNKVRALAAIAQKRENKAFMQQALKIAKSIYCEFSLPEALVAIAEKTEDQEVIEQVVEIVRSNMSDEEYMSDTFMRIASETKDTQQALRIVSNYIDDEDAEAQALDSIVAKIEDISEALEVANRIPDYIYREEALLSVALRMKDTQQILERVKSISEMSKIRALSQIALKTEDIPKALEIANSLDDTVLMLRQEALAIVASKIEDTQQALEIVNGISSKSYKLEALLAIAEKKEDKELLKQALEVANNISDNSYKAKVLVTIALKLEGVEKALEIANSVNDSYKTEALMTIVSKIEDTQQALEIANSISDDISRLRTIVQVIEKSENKYSLKDFETFFIK